jgi:hypothetical protein
MRGQKNIIVTPWGSLSAGVYWIDGNVAENVGSGCEGLWRSNGVRYGIFYVSYCMFYVLCLT